MKNPPILIAVIGFFAALAGFGFLFFGLRVLGFDWFGVLGDLPTFDKVGLWGWLAVATGIIWLLAALGLWALQPWARLFTQIMAGFGLFEAILAFIQFPGTGVGFAMALMPAFILWYLHTKEVKEAFGVGGAAPAAVAAAAAAPEAATAPTAAAPAADQGATVGAAPLAAAAIVASDRDEPTATAPAAPVAAAAIVAADRDEPAEPAPAAAAVAATEPASAPTADPSAAPAAESASAGATRLGTEDIEGIGPAEAAKLAAVGITTTDGLLAAGAKRGDRERIAEATGISPRLILDWVDIADLMRVPGVGPQYSDLLEAAGVDSPAELAQRNATNLAVTVQEVVAARPGIVRRIPTEAEIAGWISEAARLDKVVEH